MLNSAECQQLDRDGYLVLPNIVSARQLQSMRAKLDALLEVTPQDHAGTLIVGGLLEDSLFDAAWSHARVLAAVRHLLGEEHRLLGVSLRGLRPGHGQQALHADWGGQGLPGVWYACHAICALVDFTERNGATRVVPGSHRNPHFLQGRFDPRKPHRDQRQLVGPAGTVFVLNVHCAHSAVQNDAKEPRLALFSNFSRRDSPLLVGMDSAHPSPATLARHVPEVRALLLP